MPTKPNLHFNSLQACVILYTHSILRNELYSTFSDEISVLRQTLFVLFVVFCSVFLQKNSEICEQISK